MALAILGGIFALIFAAASAIILRFAFVERSAGTGVMVLLVPGYIFYFAFEQFEHRYKPLILSAWLASLGLAAVFLGLADHALTLRFPSEPV